MDAIDRKIVELLRANARLPLKSIAATVDLARSSVRERISKLETAGVILGYHARVADVETVCAMLHLTLARTPSPPTVAAIVAMPEVRRCYSLSGEIDLSVELEAPGATLLNEARDRIAAYPDVVEVVTALILKRDKDV